MKKTYLYIAFAAVAFGTTSCDKLDTKPEGGTIIEGQITEETLKYQVNSMYQELAGGGNTFGGEEHTDYGIPAMNMRLESDGMDMVSKLTGYNHYSTSLTYASRSYESSGTMFIWYRNYNIIRSCNYILGKVGDTHDLTLLNYVAEAKALRAYAYMNLAQCYQFPYSESTKQMPCVPILDEKTSIQQGNNNPRQTVETVYAFIGKDLDDAVELFAQTSSTIARRDMMTVNEDVARGLRARYRLLIHDYTGALADAEAVLAKGYTPYGMNEVSTPTFISANDHSWIWGLVYDDESYTVKTGIANWPSHLCSFVTNGYTTLGNVYRCINSNLYAQISPSDVRKGWWLDGNGASEMIQDEADAQYQDYVDSHDIDNYAVLKFAPAAYNCTTFNNNQDYPMMRAEEMILIKAECQAYASSVSEAQETLVSFVKTYRDPYYESSATSAEELVDEVWMQRRIELWGEGFAFQDILRLHKDVDRRDSNFGEDYQWLLPADSQALIYRIPKDEIERNHSISEDDNNPMAELPSVK